MITTADLIGRIAAENPEIECFRLIRFQKQKDAKEDSGGKWQANDEEAFRFALRLKREMAVPFWHGIMLASFNGGGISDNCLEASLRHNTISTFALVQSAEVEDLKTIAEENDRVAVNSEVRLKDGTIMHLPMLDFHIPFREENTPIVKAVCRLLDIPGFIISSGQSYHFLGLHPFDSKAMIDFLGKSLRFTPIVDDIWISHQLQDGSCSLRLGYKNGTMPLLIEEIGTDSRTF